MQSVSVQQTEPEPVRTASGNHQPQSETQTASASDQSKHQLRSSDSSSSSSSSSSDSGAPWLSEGVPTTSKRQSKSAVDKLLSEVEDAAFMDLASTTALVQLKQGVDQLEAAVDRLTPRRDVEEQAQAPKAQRSLADLEAELAKARRATHKQSKARQSAEIEAAQALRFEQRVRRQEQAASERQQAARDYAGKMAEMIERQRLAEERRLKRDLLRERKEDAEHRRECRAAKTASAREEWERARRLQLESELAYHASAAAASGKLAKTTSHSRRRHPATSDRKARPSQAAASQ